MKLRGGKAYDEDHSGDHTPGNANASLKEASLVAEQREDAFLNEEGRAQGSSKGPADDTSDCKPEHALRGLEATAPVHKGRRADHGHVHGKAGGEVGGAGVEVPGAGHGSHDEDEADPRVEGRADDLEQVGLAEGAEEGEDVADEVELADLGGLSAHLGKGDND